MLLLNKYSIEDKTEEKVFEKLEKELNLSKEEIIYNIREEKVGILKSTKVILDAYKKEDLKELINKFLENTAKGLNIEIESNIELDNESISINLSSNNSSALIGKNGKMLNSIQLLLKKLIEIQTGMNLRINLDIENYKKRKIENLERDVKKIIKDVLKTKVDVKLDPMNSYERRIIHNLVSKYGQLTSESEGEEPNRYIVIKYIEG